MMIPSILKISIRPDAVPDDIQRIVREWPTIVGSTDALLRGYLSKVKLSLGDGNKLLICCKDAIAHQWLDSRREEISGVVSTYIDKEVSVEIKQYDDTKHFENQYVDLGKLLGGIEIEEE